MFPEEMRVSVSAGVLRAVENSPSGVVALDVLESLGLGSRQTLRVTLSRLGRSGRIVRLKRGVYSANPPRDVFACAQSVFNGYLGFSTALYLHGIITEMPFTVAVVTPAVSQTKRFGEFEFKAVALKEKAVGFEERGGRVVSTRAKTFFDCLYLPKYSVGRGKLVAAYKQARLSGREWREFGSYVKKFASGEVAERMVEAAKAARGVARLD